MTTIDFIDQYTELSAPVIVNITDVTNETMLITWTSMDEVESFTIVYVGGSGNKVPLRVNVTGEKTSHVLTELQSGETYSVTVIGEKGLALAESEPRTATTGIARVFTWKQHPFQTSPPELRRTKF